MIARHSCPFVRHLIASRGSHGILRGGYLRPPSDLFDRVRVSGTRGSSRRYLPDTFSPPPSFLSHPSEPTIRRTDFLSLQPGSVWSCANYRVTRKPIAHFPRKRRVIRAQGWGTKTPTRFLESNDSGLSRSTNNRGHRDTNRCEIINRTDSRHFPVLYARDENTRHVHQPSDTDGGCCAQEFAFNRLSRGARHMPTISQKPGNYRCERTRPRNA